MSDYIYCPKCGGEGLTAITYAYHTIKQDAGYGPQLEHTDWSDEYALICWDCLWAHGDPKRPDRNDNLADILDPKLQELRQFEEELRRMKSTG